jgi:hypothetical protein
MQNVIKYKLGSPFPVSAIGIGFLFVVLPIYFLIKISVTLGIILLSLTCFGLILIFLKQTLVIDKTSKKYMFQKNFLGIKFGKRQGLNDVKGIIIRHRILSDKTNLSRKGSFMLNAANMNQFYSNQYHKNQTWSAQLYINKTKKINVCDSDKITTISIAKDFIEMSDLDVYSGVFKQDRKLDKTELIKNNLVFLSPPKSGKRK